VALRSGGQRILATRGNILAVERSAPSDHLVILANLSREASDYNVSGRDLLSGETIRNRVRLAPYQATIIEY
jgi:hypothetical protein